MEYVLLLQNYIHKYAKDKGTLTMSLNSYLELNLPTAADEAQLGN